MILRREKLLLVALTLTFSTGCVEQRPARPADGVSPRESDAKLPRDDTPSSLSAAEVARIFPDKEVTLERPNPGLVSRYADGQRLYFWGLNFECAPAVLRDLGGNEFVGEIVSKVWLEGNTRRRLINEFTIVDGKLTVDGDEIAQTEDAYGWTVANDGVGVGCIRGATTVGVLSGVESLVARFGLQPVRLELGCDQTQCDSCSQQTFVFHERRNWLDPLQPWVPPYVSLDVWEESCAARASADLRLLGNRLRSTQAWRPSDKLSSLYRTEGACRQEHPAK